MHHNSFNYQSTTIANNPFIPDQIVSSCRIAVHKLKTQSNRLSLNSFLPFFLPGGAWGVFWPILRRIDTSLNGLWIQLKFNKVLLKDRFSKKSALMTKTAEKATESEVFYRAFIIFPKTCLLSKSFSSFYDQ